jgi:hypothetical protein
MYGGRVNRAGTSGGPVSVHQGYRLALDPTARQRSALASHCGAARRAFNWGLEQVDASLALSQLEEVMGLPRSEPLGWSLAALRRERNREKDGVVPWWRENSAEDLRGHHRAPAGGHGGDGADPQRHDIV